MRPQIRALPRAARLAALLATLPAACSPDPAGQGSEGVDLYVDAGVQEIVEDYLLTLPELDARVFAAEEPVEEAEGGGEGGRLAVAVVADLSCVECYRIERQGEEGPFVVRGDAPLGVQYGLSHLLELHGVRFFHPWRTVVPQSLALSADAGAVLGRTFEPEVADRGLHLHTLHPIEGLYDVWIPSDEGLEGARRIVDWTIRNRGDVVQWPALDDILREDAAWAAWREHTARLVEEAHRRGVRIGVGVQIFGSGNLQRAFDLVDGGDPSEWREEMSARIARLTDGVPFDLVNLSFGEFFGEEPETFVEAVNLAYEVVQEHLPGAEVTAVIHVGNSEELRVEYQGQELLYYFLVQFADPAIVPWVHTVMYYNLYEDAGGAYLHEEFDEHREFLLERLAEGEPVGYFPETAYWIAFDNPVPTYLPVYVRSRFTDLAETRGRSEDLGGGPLPAQVLFSSGWEWGYWQNDYAAMRMAFRLPETHREAFREMWAPFGEAGERLADAIADLADAQHRALIEQRLAPYVASRDSVMDVGYQLGIVSQPERPTFEEVHGFSSEERAAFAEQVASGLESLAAETRAVLQRIEGLDLAEAQDFADEVVDGVLVDALRAEYAAALWRAVLAHADAGTDEGHLQAAAAALEEARRVVERRHGRMWDPDPTTLRSPDENPTIYQYGYLYRADQLCFWERERVQVEAIVLGVQGKDPGCAL